MRVIFGIALVMSLSSCGQSSGEQVPKSTIAEAPVAKSARDVKIERMEAAYISMREKLRYMDLNKVGTEEWLRTRQNIDDIEREFESMKVIGWGLIKQTQDKKDIWKLDKERSDRVKSLI